MALPVALERVQEMGVPRHIGALVLPFSMSFNTTGSNLFIALGSIFCAQAAGIELSAGQIGVLLVTLFLTTKGIGAVPRGSLVIIAGALTQFGILAPVSAIAAFGAGAVATPFLVARLGMRRTALLGIALVPLEGVFFAALALMPSLPPLPVFAAIFAVLGFGTSVYTFVVNNSRFRWVSKAQAGTDYSLQSSLWNFGIWVAGSLSGFVAGAIGWAAFFPFAALLTTGFGIFYFVMFDRIEALVRQREAEEIGLETEAAAREAA